MSLNSSRPRGGFFFALILAAFIGHVTPTLAATLLPNGKQTFSNANGAPLAGGTVTFYIPGTTTLKPTWEDAGQTIQNTNPVALDIAGSAVIYGSGCYRQIVKDSGGNTIWDQPTCDTSSTSLIWAGTSGGTGNSQTITASNFSGANGQTISFIAGSTNTAAEGLIVNGGSPINVLKDTAAGSFSLSGGEIFAGNAVTVIYEATRGAFHLANNPVVGSQPKSILASAGTVDLGSAASRYVEISGTSTISAFGTSASTNFPIFTVQFQSTATLANSGNLVLPGGENIITRPGDVLTALYQGSGTWYVVQYTRDDGSARVNTKASTINLLVSCPFTVPTTAGGTKASFIEVELWGGGGGGGGNGNDGGPGGTTTFNTITANGGQGGIHSANAFGVDGGLGGQGGSGSADLRIGGEPGAGSPATEGAGGVGASVGLGGRGGRAPIFFSTTGSPSPSNTSNRMGGGFGGGGAGYTANSTSISPSSGGGGGESARITYFTPLPDTFACAFGAGGTAGTSGGAGGAGGITVRSTWQ